MTISDKKFELENYLPYQLVKLAKKVADAGNTEFAAPFNVSLAEWRILATIGQAGTISSRGLPDRTFMDKSKVSRALIKLEAKKLIAREPNNEDNRSVLLKFTPGGIELYNMLIKLAQNWEADLLSIFDEQERATFIESLAKLHDKIRISDSQQPQTSGLEKN